MKSRLEISQMGTKTKQRTNKTVGSYNNTDKPLAKKKRERFQLITMKFRLLLGHTFKA